MKGSIIASLAGAIAVLLIGAGIFYFGGLDLYREWRCSSPLIVTSLDNVLSKGSPQASGGKLSKLSLDSNSSFYVADLPPQKSTEAVYHETGVAYYQIISGEGVFHSGKVESKENTMPTIKWYLDVPVSALDFIEVPPNTVSQLENTQEKDPLLYIIIAPEAEEKNAIKTESFDPAKSRCKKKEKPS